MKKNAKTVVVSLILLSIFCSFALASEYPEQGTFKPGESGYEIIIVNDTRVKVEANNGSKNWELKFGNDAALVFTITSKTTPEGYHDFQKELLRLGYSVEYKTVYENKEQTGGAILIVIFSKK